MYPSAELGGPDIAGGDFVLVGGEGCQDFGLLALRDLGKVQAPSELCGDRIKFCGGDAEVAMGLLKAERRLAGLGGRDWKGPPETLQTQSVRMNLRPGNLPRFLVCHSRSCGFLDFWPTMGFFTTASLKWFTTAAMAKTPPSRSYKLFSGMVCVACAWALSAAANIVIGAVVTASPATTFRLVIELETDRVAVTSLARATERGKVDLDDCMGTSFVTADCVVHQ
jgi:hypothetical protein